MPQHEEPKRRTVRARFRLHFLPLPHHDYVIAVDGRQYGLNSGPHMAALWPGAIADAFAKAMADDPAVEAYSDDVLPGVLRLRSKLNAAFLLQVSSLISVYTDF